MSELHNNIFSLENKTVYVTGGTRGIGEAAAHTFAAAGANVAIAGTNKARAEAVAHDIEVRHGVKALPVIAEVTDPDAVTRMMNDIVRVFGTIDIGFNNAGICIHQDALGMTYEQWRQVIDVNLTGVFLCCQAAAKIMVKQNRGVLINNASMSGSIVNLPQWQCSYNASKAGVIHLTKSLAVEWAQYNIRVNSISPGYINTPMSGDVRKDWQSQWMELSVTKRFGTPDDLAPALLYLASDASAFTTGSDVVVDGGYSCS